MPIKNIKMSDRHTHTHTETQTQKWIQRTLFQFFLQPIMDRSNRICIFADQCEPSLFKMWKQWSFHNAVMNYWSLWLDRLFLQSQFSVAVTLSCAILHCSLSIASLKNLPTFHRVMEMPGKVLTNPILFPVDLITVVHNFGERNMGFWRLGKWV